MNHRVSHSASIQSNIISGAAGQFRLCQHLAGLARGSMLFAKLSLDLIERGNLVAKSTSYKVLPVSLAEIYLLHFNLRFPTTKSYEKVICILLLLFVFDYKNFKMFLVKDKLNITYFSGFSNYQCMSSCALPLNSPRNLLFC